jgi:hypothetical protein
VENVIIGGTSNGAILGFDIANTLTVKDYDNTVSVTVADAGEDDDTLNLTVDGADEAVVDVVSNIENLNLVAEGAASEFTYQTNAAFEAATVSGDADVSVIFDGHGADFETFDASDATGDVTMIVGLASDLTATGGKGDDTFDFNDTLNAGDTIDGGDGDDTLVAEVDTTGTLRPTVTNVESLDLTFAQAGTFDARNITGARSLELSNIGAAVTVTRLAETVTSLLLTDGEVGTDAISLTYAADADSDVTLTVGASNDDEDDVASLGNITIVGNEGALVINSEGDDDNDVDAVEADDAISLTINANVNGLTTTTVSAAAAEFVTINATAGDVETTTIGAADATDFTLNATGGDITITNATLTDATTIALNATGGAIETGFLLTDADDVEVNLVADGEDNNITVALIDADHATSFNFTATDGAAITVTDIDTLGIDTEPEDIDNEINITANGEDSSVTVTFASLDANAVVDIVTMISDEDGAVSFTVTASGVDAEVTEVDATDSAGATTINLAGLDVGSEISTGSGNATITGTAGNDTIIAGSGDDTINGGGGQDEITTGGGSDTIVFSAVNFVAGNDVTIIDFTAGEDGDVISVEADGIIATLDEDNFVDDVEDAASDSIIVLSAVSYADFDEAEADIELENPATLSYIVVFLNSTSGVVEVYADEDSSDVGDGILLASFDNIISLAGVAELTADNFLTFA